jgi:hypothetical protein
MPHRHILLAFSQYQNQRLFHFKGFLIIFKNAKTDKLFSQIDIYLG